MDIRTELHNLKRMVLNESHISETTKEKIANRIFEIEKSAAINYTHCCKSDSELLKDKVKLTFKNWLFSSGIRYVSGHNYKSNDGDIYDIDELEKMYKHYLSL